MELMSKMDNNFSQLLTGLNVGLIVLIDDDFVLETNSERIVSEIACMRKGELEFLIQAFIKANLGDVAQHIQNTMREFHDLPINEENWPSLKQVKRIVYYLDKIGTNEAFSVKYMMEELITLVHQQMHSNFEFCDILLRYGVGVKKGNSYWDILKYVEKASIRYYKRKPAVEIILEDMDESLLPAQFCICIVDKKLEDDDGVRFIKEELFPLCPNKNLISIIYTSNPENVDIENLTRQQELLDYYLVEVDKGADDAIIKLTQHLALCAFVELFNRLSKIQSSSIEKSFKLALSRKNNMVYLASMAHEEGITPFEAISNWYQLATQYWMVKEMMDNTHFSVYQYIQGLTRFLKEEYFQIENSAKIEEESMIQDLSNFEIFDYTVNQQNQPPGVGDVYELADGKYAVLVGQDCDLVVRGTKVTRNTKHADLLKADFIPTRIFEKVKKESKTVEFDYFCRNVDKISQFGVLKVKFENPLTSDFIILDLCTFNQDGKSVLNISTELIPEVKNVIPLAWRAYHSKLIRTLEQYLQYRELCESAELGVEILRTNDIATIDYQKTENTISYPVRRICRIKKEFRDILLKSFWEYRSRTATNTIGLIETEKISNLDIQIGYPGQKHCTLNSLEVEAYIRKSNKRSRNREIQKLPLILKIDTLKTEHTQIKEIHDDIIQIDGKSVTHPETKIVFTKNINENNIDSVSITVPYRLEYNEKILQKDSFTLPELLTLEQMKIVEAKKNDIYFVLETPREEKKQIYDTKRNKYVKLEVEQLLKGVIIPELNIKIQICDGIIKIIESALVSS
ncbi:hypothetical protein [Paenibacillus dendritiformis]|uniref:hypothetical protein n=1 Tax=Paenibacillus dendritiformis TaxID=130049 RepID=UPI000DA89950|nr:hypothetical protein [Paenibacillus dendritiformis]PZM62174.1 hypothetical protein DOE73_28655 [Paenibacillus dendritiformis]